MKKICERFKKARIDAGFRSARNFAAQYGINERTYRSHELGEYEPSIETLIKYCKIFNVSPS